MASAKSLARISVLAAVGICSGLPIVAIHNATVDYCERTHIVYQPIPGVSMDLGSVCDQRDMPWPLVEAQP